MRRSLAFILAAGVFGVIIGGAHGERTAEVKALLDRAIQATGGKANLAAIKVISGAGTGTYRGGFFALNCDVSGVIRFPAEKRMELDFGADGFRVVHVQVLNGDQGWIKSRGQAGDMNDEQLAEMQDDIYVDWLSTLVPLLQPEFRLTALGQSQVNGHAVQGIRVNRKGRPNVELYFDSDNSLLRKAEVTVNDNLVQDYLYSDYQSFQGVQRATRQTILRNGKDFMDVRFSDVEINPALGPNQFNKP